MRIEVLLVILMVTIVSFAFLAALILFNRKKKKEPKNRNPKFYPPSKRPNPSLSEPGTKKPHSPPKSNTAKPENPDNPLIGDGHEPDATNPVIPAYPLKSDSKKSGTASNPISGAASNNRPDSHDSKKSDTAHNTSQPVDPPNNRSGSGARQIADPPPPLTHVDGTPSLFLEQLSMTHGLKVEIYVGDILMSKADAIFNPIDANTKRSILGSVGGGAVVDTRGVCNEDEAPDDDAPVDDLIPLEHRLADKNFPEISNILSAIAPDANANNFSRYTLDLIERVLNYAMNTDLNIVSFPYLCIDTGREAVKTLAHSFLKQFLNFDSRNQGSGMTVRVFLSDSQTARTIGEIFCRILDAIQYTPPTPVDG